MVGIFCENSHYATRVLSSNIDGYLGQRQSRNDVC